MAGLGATLAISDFAAFNEALAHAARAVTLQPPPPFKVLTADEGRELDAITSRIVPTTDTPGAKEAGVVYFIDQALGGFQKDALTPLRGAIADLKKRAARRKRGATFASLSAADQDAVLTGAEKEPWFGQLVFLTWAGMFSEPSYGGNRSQVGWKLLDFNPHGPHKPPFGYYDAEANRA